MANDSATESKELSVIQQAQELLEIDGRGSVSYARFYQVGKPLLSALLTVARVNRPSVLIAERDELKRLCEAQKTLIADLRLNGKHYLRLLEQTIDNIQLLHNDSLDKAQAGVGINDYTVGVDGDDPAGELRSFNVAKGKLRKQRRRAVVCG